MSSLRLHVLTNLAYGVAGTALLLTGALWAGIGLITLGICSWIGHDRGGYWWFLDWAGMYLAFISIIAQNLGYGWVALFLYPIVIAVTLEHRLDSVLLIGVLLAASLITGFMAGASVFVSILLFAVAFLVRQLPGKTSVAYNILHGLWHLFTAAAMIFLVKSVADILL